MEGRQKKEEAGESKRIPFLSPDEKKRGVRDNREDGGEEEKGGM